MLGTGGEVCVGGVIVAICFEVNKWDWTIVELNVEKVGMVETRVGERGRGSYDA